MEIKVDRYLRKAKKWQEELKTLRQIVLDCGLEEEYKWMHPCYTHRGANIVLIHEFKDYCALLFFKGVLMKDPEGILIQQTENVQDRRQVRFTNVQEIIALEATLKAYILEAIAIEKAGLKVTYKNTTDFEVPEELRTKFAEDPHFKRAFEALTPGRQKAYLLHFGQAKQAKTREARIEKYRPKILDGKGLLDD
ncbi:MAG: YdeI family protein [Maribacter sp.]|nr:YdeI family protein [Maribacter sp.]